MARRHLIGIDGGASSTSCLVADESGRIRGEAEAGPMDHLYHRLGRTRTRVALTEALGTALRRARARGKVAAVVAGLTGLDSGTPEAGRARRMLMRLVNAERVVVTSDVEIAFAGAAGGGSGVMVIAGTGSVAFGRNARGRTARAGGHGFLIDDAGGGVAIGQAGLRAAMRAEDGRGPHTRLREIVRARLGEWPAVRRRVYGAGGGRMFLAHLAPMVEEAAASGDPVARQILGDAASALAQLGLAVARRLDLLDDEFPFFLVGGIFNIGAPLLTRLKEELRAGAPRSRVDAPSLPPAAGALVMAIRAAGLEVTPEVIRRLRASSR